MNESLFKARKRFCKDLKLPLNVFDDPYFTNRVQLMGKEHEYKRFLHLLEYKYNSDIEAYFEEYNNVKDEVIKYIIKSEAYIKLNNCDMNMFKVNSSIPKAQLFTDKNVGKTFISIDMEKANFSSLVAFAKMHELEFYANFDYTDFMSQFTNDDWIINSKYIRQVIFGHCNPKRQMGYSRFLMKLLLDDLFEQKIVSILNIHSYNYDEIIIEGKETIQDISDIYNCVEKFSSELFGLPMHFELFRLGKIKGTDAYAKHNLVSNTNTLKCVNPVEAPFIYRYMNGMDPDDEDLYFDYNGKLAKLVEYNNVELTYNIE